MKVNPHHLSTTNENYLPTFHFKDEFHLTLSNTTFYLLLQLGSVNTASTHHISSKNRMTHFLALLPSFYLDHSFLEMAGAVVLHEIENYHHGFHANTTLQHLWCDKLFMRKLRKHRRKSDAHNSH